jgi:hypothetical protein
VDLPPPGPEFKQKADYLFDRLEDASSEYKCLCMLNSESTGTGGFAYLNSESSVALQHAQQGAMRAAVEGLCEPFLTELYSLWTRTNDLREEAMLDCVEAYAQETHFTKGVLLVGADHITSLFTKTQARRSVGSSSVCWDFDWRLERPFGDGDT